MLKPLWYEMSMFISVLDIKLRANEMNETGMMSVHCLGVQVPMETKILAY